MKGIPSFFICLIFFIFISNSAWSQMLPAPVWPFNHIAETSLCNPVIDGNGTVNTVECKYKWEGDTIPALLGNHPSKLWKYVWLFGDGTVIEGDSVQHTFNAAGRFGVYARAVPIYSPTNPPPIKRTSVDVPQLDGIPDSLQGYNIQIVPDFSTQVVGDTLILAILYRRNEIYNQLGDLKLKIIKDDLSFGSAELMNETIIAPSQDQGNGVLNLNWNQRPLPRPNQDTMVFVKLKVNENQLASNPDPVNPSLKTTIVEAAIDWDASRRPPPTGNKGAFDLGFGNKDDLFVDNPESVLALDRQLFSITSSRDPNSIALSPLIIPPGKGGRLLDGVIKAQNMGSAGAKKIVIKPVVDNDLEFNSLKATSLAIENRPNVLLSPEENVNLSQSTSSWTMNAKPEAGMRYILASYGEFNTDSATLKATIASLHFTVNTPERKRLRIGDEIKMKALIRMDFDSVWTNTAVVKVDLPVKLPLTIGLKVEKGFNAGSIFNGSQRIALTARWALRGMSDYYSTRRIIPLHELPVLWYQAELGYQESNLTLDVDDKYKLRQIALTPIMLRFVPRLPKIPNISHQRYLGLSVSYDAAYTYKSTLNGVDFNPVGLKEHLMHGFSASLDMLNILGYRGVSAGIGNRWQYGQLQGQSFRVSYPFFYVHYNLGF